MFIVDKPDYINKTFRMEKNLVERLGKVAQNTGVSLNELVVQCCRYALDNMENSEQEEKPK
ncbi:hypothetical protein [Eisenbergiella tayi]|uniref:hypothetical protein n=1 Tax=Eisenbergiella tayi TaxID=1432052 RepID=UPI00084939D1|nr:hypothetical protein [Eisenbergiella tayi]ODR34585.1 hypothetical protein BEI60_22715 [Eisenbergiella tayi]